MKILSNPQATREQLPIVSRNTTGIVVIRGAAGSGKTTSALLRLTAITNTLSFRKKIDNDQSPIKTLVLSFNRTLSGYIEGLIDDSIQIGSIPVEVENDTFANWTRRHINTPIIEDLARDSYLSRKCAALGYDIDFILGEIDYLRGRFRSSDLDRYLTIERTGRGLSPQVTRVTRQRLIDIVREYEQYLSSYKLNDWHTQCEKMVSNPCLEYDIIVVDETQDFSANQIRAILNHLKDDYYLTFVIDTIQRLYPRGFTWAETGLDMRNTAYYRLGENHRNTIEIAAFAASITNGLTVDDDGSISDFRQTTRHGPKPIVCKGLYSQQVKYAINYIRRNVNLQTESVAFLKPKGGKWFSEIERQLQLNNLPYITITRNRIWPKGPENIAISTMNSAKGLEFDHVIILGLSIANMQHQDGEYDDKLQQLRRLLAMAISRAKESVIIGYKESEKSDLIDYFTDGTFEEINL
ncbi:helicase [Yersinia enterocolitica]|uniref:3'-5' exonuclease n=1 Tax=Yersinia enterocolitica TaxID=630 RepID=UPI00155AA32E|nr:3'-5' exonuclease [Yersinia enterocolitica]MBX9485815.1 helicase [Yersinia enterocolitica]NQS96724.1 helicase [Yersinia enterocolitica]NQT43401.1 helicase [Yersinia enterocolitica]NQT98799.1 helicase [Yersinia enterocolitica]HDM8448665.1 helicase [Yersinia enterocolitica]